MQGGAPLPDKGALVSLFGPLSRSNKAIPGAETQRLLSPTPTFGISRVRAHVRDARRGLLRVSVRATSVWSQGCVS